MIKFKILIIIAGNQVNQIDINLLRAYYLLDSFPDSVSKESLPVGDPIILDWENLLEKEWALSWPGYVVDQLLKILQ